MFRDIDIERVDRDKIKDVGGGKKIVPYILSAVPPMKWTHYFLETINGSGFTTRTSEFSRTSDLPIAGGTTKIEDNRVLSYAQEMNNALKRVEIVGKLWGST